MSDQLRWFLLLLLSSAMAIAYVDRINLSVVLALPEFASAFELDSQRRGLLNSAFFWSYALFQIPAGIVVDRYGTKYPLAICFLLWSLASAVTAFVSSFEGIFLLRLVLGACESVVAPAILRWIRFNMSDAQRGLAIGIYTAGSKVGTIVAVPLATLLVILIGWRGMFLVLGLGCLLWLIPWLALARRDDVAVFAGDSAGCSAPPLSFRRILMSPVMLGINIGTFCYSYFVIFCLTWLPSYFVEHRGLSLGAMSVFTMAAFAGLAIMAPIGGFLADRMIASGHDRVSVHRKFTIAGMLIGCSQVIGAFSDSTSVALFFAVVSLAGLGLTTANFWALTSVLVPARSIGRAIGIQNCASSLSGVAASILSGWLLQRTGSYEAPMLAIFVFLVIGSGAYHVFARQRFSLIGPDAEPLARAITRASSA